MTEASAAGWERVVGQERAVAALQRAASRPVHAYLLVGPRGSGVEDAARSFAATLVAPGDRRVGDLVGRGTHPDVVEIDPTGNQVVIADAQALVREAHASPIECDRKVVILSGADRLNDTAANALLKTIEEPPARTTIVLLAERVDRLPATIRSRCQRIDFSPLDEATVRSALGDPARIPLPEARVDLIARLAGGRMDRALALADRLGPVRDAFVDAAEALDGTGAAAERAAVMLVDALAQSVTELETRHHSDLEQVEAELSAAGYPSRVVAARRRAVADRQKREHRRARTDALLEGITAIESLLRDALAGSAAPRRNIDRPSPDVDPRAVVHALDACRSARRGLVEFNANEMLTVERLLLHLPAIASGSGSRPG